MIALYTEVFKDFLTKYDVASPTTPDQIAWSNIKTKFSKFPDFNLFDDTTFKFDMYTLFKDKYEIFEIGCETESIFFHEVNDKVNELLVKFAPKMREYIDNFANALSRKVTLSQSGTTSNLLYPISNSTGKVASSVNFTGSKDSMLMIFRSNAELMNQAMNIRDIYLDCLTEFSVLFMGIY